MREHYPQRKLLRLSTYDYSQNGAYFVTLCTKHRQPMFGTVVEGVTSNVIVDGVRLNVGAIHESPAHVLLSDYGKIVDSQIHTLPDRFPQAIIDIYCIMPNHIHLLIVIENERAIHESPLHDAKRSTLSQMIGNLKANTTKEIRKNHPALEIWQVGYHDHIVRCEEEYALIWRYIDENPARWTTDKYFT